jgi:hypothetical protein
MNALEPFIGLSPVDSGSERMYVNRLPNVSPEMVQAIAEDDDKNTESPTGLETIWQEVKDEAYESLKSCLLGEMAKRSTFREVVDRSELPDLITVPESITVGGDKMIGVVVTMPKSRYQCLFIRNLYIQYGTMPEKTIIRIYDGDMARQIGADLEVDSKESDMDYPVNISVDCSKVGSRSIFIGALVPDGVTILSMNWNLDCNHSINDLYLFDPSESPLMETMTELDDCFVAVEYEIRLSSDLLVSRFADRLKRVYQLMCGIGIIDRGLKSKKASRWTLVNRDMELKNLEDLKADLKKEMANACRLIHPELEKERLALVSRPDDQPGYFISDYV